MSSENKLDGNLPTPGLILVVADYPTANGRQPKDGEQAYSFHFALADGSNLRLDLGRETRDKFRQFLMQEEVDDAVEKIMAGLSSKAVEEYVVERTENQRDCKYIYQQRLI